MLVNNRSGFTLVELVVALGLTAIVATAVFNLFTSQTRSFDIQEQNVALHQNLRVSMEVMQRDLRMAGFDPTITTGIFAITDVRNRDLTNALNINGEHSIQFTADLDSNGVVGAGETFAYSIYDSPVATPDGIRDLARQVGGGGRQMLGEAVENLGFAYAYTDDDGTLVMNPVVPPGGSPEPLWAFDSNNDNILDAAVDQNGDGVIDVNDGQNGAPLPNLISGTNLIQLDRIQAVKIWMLGRTLQVDRSYQSNRGYKVGNRVIPAPNDNFRRQLLTSVVKFRNLGL